MASLKLFNVLIFVLFSFSSIKASTAGRHLQQLSGLLSNLPKPSGLLSGSAGLTPEPPLPSDSLSGGSDPLSGSGSETGLGGGSGSLSGLPKPSILGGSGLLSKLPKPSGLAGGSGGLTGLPNLSGGLTGSGLSGGLMGLMAPQNMQNFRNMAQQLLKLSSDMRTRRRERLGRMMQLIGKMQKLMGSAGGLTGGAGLPGLN